MKRLLPILALIMILLLIQIPTLAQGNDPTPDTNPIANLIDLDAVIIIAASIGLVILIGGSLLLGFRGLEAAKVQVPQEVVNVFSTQIVSAMVQVMDFLEHRAKETPSPFDDPLVAAGRIPVDILITELNKRTLTPAQSLQAYQALQEETDLTLPETD